jgi:hypothetical protein
VKVQPLVLRVDAVRHSDSDLDAILAMLQAHPGDVPVHLKVRIRTGQEAMLAMGDELRVTVNDDLRKALGLWLG